MIPIGAVSETMRVKMEASLSRRQRERALFPHITCLHCHDSGEMEFQGKTIACFCQTGKEMERERERAAWLERVDNEVGVPGQIRRDVERQQFQQQLMQSVQGCIGSCRGAYLYGGTGRGKSVAAAAALLQFVRSTGDVRVSPRQCGVFTTAAGYLQGIRDSYGDGVDQVRGGHGVHGCGREAAQLLVLDDLGLERLTEWGAEQLTTLIDHRTTHGLPTIVTSNLTLDQLRKKYNRASPLMGDRIVSRLRGHCEVIHVDGPDWRMKR